MKIGLFPAAIFAICSFCLSLPGQTPVVINLPGEAAAVATMPSEADQALIRRSALPKVRKKLSSEICEESFEPAGIARGAFSRPNSNQRAVFYQFCQTGNGLGYVGLILIEGDKVVGSFVSDVGWSAGVKALPDVNRNGLDEIALYYSGGMHQGAGGTGVDIVEIIGNSVKGIGWFQAEGFGEDIDTFGYKVMARRGRSPAFFREKYIQTEAGKWRRSGRATPFRPQKTVGVFTAVR